MKEQSHKEEMSAAIRGDFQRLRERGVPVSLGRRENDASDDPPDEAPVDADPVAPAVPPELASAEAAQDGRSWLGRLVGR